MPTDLSALASAIAADDAAAAQALLRARPELLRVLMDGSGRSPLHVAAHHDARRVAETLLAAGADFYARDANGQLPLDLPPGQEMNATRRWLPDLNKSRNEFLAAVHGQKVDLVEELLGRDPSLAKSRDIGDGWSGVMTACHVGNEPLLRVLLDAGAPVDATDFNSGQDATFICAEKGAARCLRLLVDAGADPKRSWAVNYGRLPMRMNALHVAAWKGHDQVVALLLSLKLDVNERAASCAVFSPLHLAATDGHAKVVKQLLDAGADRRARDGRRGITALEMAEAGKHAAAADLLRN